MTNALSLVIRLFYQMTLQTLQSDYIRPLEKNNISLFFFFVGYFPTNYQLIEL